MLPWRLAVSLTRTRSLNTWRLVSTPDTVISLSLCLLFCLSLSVSWSLINPRRLCVRGRACASFVFSLRVLRINEGPSPSPSLCILGRSSPIVARDARLTLQEVERKGCLSRSHVARRGGTFLRGRGRCMVELCTIHIARSSRSFSDLVLRECVGFYSPFLFRRFSASLLSRESWTWAILE